MRALHCIRPPHVLLGLCAAGRAFLGRPCIGIRFGSFCCAFVGSCQRLLLSLHARHHPLHALEGAAYQRSRGLGVGLAMHSLWVVHGGFKLPGLGQVRLVLLLQQLLRFPEQALVHAVARDVFGGDGHAHALQNRVAPLLHLPAVPLNHGCHRPPRALPPSLHLLRGQARLLRRRGGHRRLQQSLLQLRVHGAVRARRLGRGLARVALAPVHHRQIVQQVHQVGLQAVLHGLVLALASPSERLQIHFSLQLHSIHGRRAQPVDVLAEHSGFVELARPGLPPSLRPFLRIRHLRHQLPVLQLELEQGLGCGGRVGLRRQYALEERIFLLFRFFRRLFVHLICILLLAGFFVLLSLRKVCLQFSCGCKVVNVAKIFPTR
mmetsp:Transcript_33161/g.63663  ORF Transcript_33161/g.63663 Transcript_33161/m.63663 type:complete len:377 (-) Transcript_33161:152-1282(-)